MNGSTASTRGRSKAAGGTGLGLAIVKHIATNYGASVTDNGRAGRQYLHGAVPCAGLTERTQAFLAENFVLPAAPLLRAKG